MDSAIEAVPYAVGLLVGMLAFFEIGRHLGRRWSAKKVAGEHGAFGIIEGALFALFGLLVAFTFSGAMSRFDARKQLIAEEANAIDTAYMRLELLPDESRSELDKLFADYVGSRIEMYRRLPDTKAANEETAHTDRIRDAIWKTAVDATGRPAAHPDAAKLLLPALNAMFDITTTRMIATRLHPPTAVYVLLFLLALWCASLAGHALSNVQPRSWAHIVAFAVFTAGTIYLILEIEYPRQGLIRIDQYDRMLVDVRNQITAKRSVDVRQPP